MKRKTKKVLTPQLLKSFFRIKFVWSCEANLVSLANQLFSSNSKFFQTVLFSEMRNSCHMKFSRNLNTKIWTQSRIFETLDFWSKDIREENIYFSCKQINYRWGFLSLDPAILTPTRPSAVHICPTLSFSSRSSGNNDTVCENYLIFAA